MLIQNNTNDYNSWNVPLLIKELRDGINQEEKDDIQKTIPVPDIYKDKYKNEESLKYSFIRTIHTYF